jgi:uncharacterized protein (DUF58 family)
MIRDAWPYVAAILIIAGLVALNAVLVLLGFALAIACGGAMLWARYALRRVTYERIVLEDHAFAGETIGITLRPGDADRRPEQRRYRRRRRVPAGRRPELGQS